MASQVLLAVLVDGLAERDVEILARPARMPLRAITHLQVVDAESLRELAGARRESRTGLLIHAQHAAIDAERRGHEGVSEQQALHFGQRKHASDDSVPLGDQVVGRVAEGPPEHVLPLGPMEERALGVSGDECIPGRPVRPGARAHAGSVRHRRPRRCGPSGSHPAGASGAPPWCPGSYSAAAGSAAARPRPAAARGRPPRDGSRTFPAAHRAR